MDAKLGMLLGASEGFRETREANLKRQDERDKEALTHYQKLLEQGFTIVDPSKGTPDGTVVRVGELGFLQAPKIDKSKMYELELAKVAASKQLADAQVEISGMQSESAKLGYVAKLKELELNLQMAASRKDLAAMERVSKQIDQETARIRQETERQKGAADIEKVNLELTKIKNESVAATSKSQADEELKRLNIDEQRLINERQSILRDKAIAEASGAGGLDAKEQLDALFKVQQMNAKLLSSTVPVAKELLKSREYISILAQALPDETTVRAYTDGGYTGWEKIAPYQLPALKQRDGSYGQMTIKDVKAFIDKGGPGVPPLLSLQDFVDFAESYRDKKGGPFKWVQSSTMPTSVPSVAAPTPPVKPKAKTSPRKSNNQGIPPVVTRPKPGSKPLLPQEIQDLWHQNTQPES